MPETLFGEADVFRGRSFNLHADLRTAIVNYLDEQVPSVNDEARVHQYQPRTWVQTLNTGYQGEQGEDEEMKNEVTQDEIFAIVQQFRKSKGEGKGKGKKGVCWDCGECDHCSREIARMTNKTTAGQMVGHGRTRKAARQEQRQAKDGMQARAIGTAGRNRKGRGKDWQGSGKSQEWHGQHRQNDCSTPAWKGKSSTKGSSEGQHIQR